MRKNTMIAALVAVVAIPLAGGYVLAQQVDKPKTEKQEPTYSCGVKVPQGRNQDLKSLAKISLAQATQAAQAAVPGTVKESALEDENGCLVYSVDIQSADGKFHDVKVDASTGTVVHQETSAKQGAEKEGAEGAEGAENETE